MVTIKSDRGMIYGKQNGAQKKDEPKEDVHCVVRIHERAKNKRGDAKEKMGVWNKKKIGGKKMNTKIVGTLAIASLIVMVVFVGTAAANGGADLYGSLEMGDFDKEHNFTTTDNLYAWGDFGDYSYTYDDPPCPKPDGCGGRLYVVVHKEAWDNGDTLTDVSGGYETVAWDDNFYRMTWQNPLTPGTYDLILDLNVSGTGNYSVWTNITNPGYGETYITDPIWTIYVTGDDPEPIPEFSTIAIPVAAILGLLFFYNYRKRRREGV